jgi:hypothetical protein
MTYYFCLNDFNIFALTFAFRFNVDKLLDPDNANLKGKTLKCHDNANLKGKTQI